MIKDVNDNFPSFQESGPIRFTVPEEEDPGRAEHLSYTFNL